MTRRIPVVVLVLVLLGAVPATAQTAQQVRLKGLTEAYVLIEFLDDNSASCGITTAGLTTAGCVVSPAGTDEPRPDESSEDGQANHATGLRAGDAPGLLPSPPVG